MIISRTPLRISFLGGGTDFPAWFKDNGGAVLSTTIDKYIYITTRYLPPFFEHKSRIVWSLIELVKKMEEIKHPAIREALRFLRIKEGVEIHYDADLPARTGLGSSSAFTVGLLNTLYALRGKRVSKRELASAATYIEQEMIKENVGCQDQVATSFGGFNLIEFRRTGEFIVKPIGITPERLKLFKQHLLLVFSGFSRYGFEITGRVLKNLKRKKKSLNMIYQLAGEAVKVITDEREDLVGFGRLLHDCWLIKKNLAEGVSNPTVDSIYTEARRAGALGGKLLGAGGGGFLLIYAQPHLHSAIKEKLKKFLIVPFEFEKFGTQMIFHNKELEYEPKFKQD